MRQDCDHAAREAAVSIQQLVAAAPATLAAMQTHLAAASDACRALEASTERSKMPSWRSVLPSLGSRR